MFMKFFRKEKQEEKNQWDYENQTPKTLIDNNQQKEKKSIKNETTEETLKRILDKLDFIEEKIDSI